MSVPQFHGPRCPGLPPSPLAPPPRTDRLALGSWADHCRREVRAFVADHPRLHVHYFPANAPELNPAESGHRPITLSPTVLLVIWPHSVIGWPALSATCGAPSTASGRAS